VHIAGRDHAPGGGNTNLRLGKIFLGEPHRIEHGATCGAVRTVKDNRGVRTKIRAGTIGLHFLFVRACLKISQKGRGLVSFPSQSEPDFDLQRAIGKTALPVCGVFAMVWNGNLAGHITK
jgi:hypothetical protein